MVLEQTTQVTPSVQTEGLPLARSKDRSSPRNSGEEYVGTETGKFHGGSLPKLSSDYVCFLCH